jgi:regulator of sigma E protease
MHFLQTIGSFALVLGVLVFFHELGHYSAARWRGIHVEAFSIGFGPALLSWTDRRETVWKLCVLPLGGFVKMHGMAVDVTDEASTDALAIRRGQAFFEKSVLSRAIVVAAGPVANFLLATLLFAGLFATVGRPVAVDNPPALVGDVAPGSSAAEAGLRPGDAIRAIDGARIAGFDDMRRIVSGSAGRTLSMRIQRGAQDLTVPVLIKPAVEGDMSAGRLGVSAGVALARERLNPAAALWAGMVQTALTTWMILQGLLHLFSGEGLHDLSGPIGIAVASGKVAQHGAVAIVEWIALLSVDLGLVNLLPVPVLDGGHLMFYGAEALRGRPLPPRAQEYGYRVGFALIGAMFLFSLRNDLVNTGAVRWMAHLIG